MNKTFQRLNIFQISFKKYGFRFLFPTAIIIAVSILKSIYLLVLFIPVTIVNLFNVKIKGLVDEISFGNTSLIIQRKWEYKFDYDNFKAQPILTYRHTKKGIKIYNDNNYVTIWEYEFSDADWEAINKRLSSLIEMEELDATFASWLSSGNPRLK